MSRTWVVLLCVLVAFSDDCHAGLKTKAAEEAAEYVMRKFGREAAEQGAETIARKAESLAVKHGDEALEAVKRVGPGTFRLVEEAGENGPQAVKLLARRGDEAVWIVSKRNRMTIFIKHGDGAAEAMIKHRAIAEPLIERLGTPAVNALQAVSARNGRRIAMMAEDGTLTQIGRTEEVLSVVGKYGDRAMDFVWRNKGSLAVSAALAAFLADPEPFLEGTADIAKIAAESVAEPLATVPGEVASEAARKADWTLVLSILSVLFGVGVIAKLCFRRRTATRLDR